MSNTQLEQSSIKSLLQAKGVQQATGRVRSEYLLEEMSLIGFVPYSVYFDYFLEESKIDLNSHLYVTPYLLRCSSSDSPIPVFHTIRRAAEKEYCIENNLLIDSNLDEIIHVGAPYLTKNINYNKPLRADKLVELIKKDRNVCNLFITKEDGTYHYIGKDSDIELSGGIGNIKCISNDFLCLCTYMNKVTGLPSYTLLPSDNTIRVLPETEDE